jgi:N-acetylglucosamine kinase
MTRQMHTSRDLVGGIEGGGTCSKMVIMDASNGKIVGRAEGKGTNHWLVGIDVAVERLGALAAAARADAGLSPSVALRALGMSLSGADKIEEKKKLVSELRRRFPEAGGKDAHLYVCNDTMGGLAAAAGPLGGGVVLIAGTGSNCRWVASLTGEVATHKILGETGEPPSKNCGGWGHMLGDEGSAFWIARAAVKAIYDAGDDFDGPECWDPTAKETPSLLQSKCEKPIVARTDRVGDVAELRRRACRYFSLGDRFDIIGHLYAGFEKSFFARFAVEVASAAQAGDALAQRIFRRAGCALGAHVAAVIGGHSKHDPTVDASTTLKVVCIGSVWRSWPLLRSGFCAAVTRIPNRGNTSSAVRLQLVRLRVSGAVGAAYLAAAAAGQTVEATFTDNFDVMDEVEARAWWTPGHNSSPGKRKCKFAVTGDDPNCKRARRLERA